MSAYSSCQQVPIGTGAVSGGWFVGRTAELRYFDECAQDVRAGQPRLVVIEGEPGIGKTALLDRAVRGLDGFHVLRATCDATEQDLPYETIAQLVSRLPALPGRTASQPPLVRLVGAAQAGADLLRLLADAQREQPVAVVVEDIHWADSESVRVLGFVLRRLFGERVLTVVTARGDGDLAWQSDAWQRTVGEQAPTEWRRVMTSLSSCRELRVPGLTITDVAELARRQGIGALPTRALAELLRYTGGHPRQIRGLLGQLRIDGTGAFDSLPVPSSCRRAVDIMLATVPAASRALAEAIAVLDSRSRLGLAARVAGVDDPVGALEPLLECGLVRWWPSEPTSPVEMRQPMQREAVYDTITPRRRRELHGAAADLVDVAQAWRHRVSATVNVDAVLADDLDRAAAACLAERDVERAVTYLLWAADMSDTRPCRERRLLSAVVHCLRSSNPARVDGLQPAVEECTSSPLRSCALGLFALVRNDLVTAKNRLTEAIDGAHADPELAWLEARAIVSLATAYVFQGDGDRAAWYARRALDHPAADIMTVREAVRCLVRARCATDGPRAALDGLDHITARGVTVDPAVLIERSVCLMLAGELPRAAEDAQAAVRLGRTEQAYLALALTEYLMGQWDDAVVNVERVLGLTVDRADLHIPARTVALLLASARGEWDAATSNIRIIEQAPGGSSDYAHVVCRAIAAAGWAQARSDYPAMVDSFGLLREIIAAKGMTGRILGWQSWWRPLLVEGLIGTGRLAEASAELVRLSGVAAETRYLRVAQAWLSGWLAERKGDVRSAATIYERGLALPVAEDDVPLHRARLEQAYGQLLQKTRDADAGTWLRRAQSHYATLGAHAYLDRCAASLAKCDVVEPVPVALPVPARLTEREREVAHFAASGMTNHEAAARLFVSEKTVEFHLGNVYSKLGLTSRRQLRDHPALATVPSHQGSA